MAIKTKKVLARKPVVVAHKREMKVPVNVSKPKPVVIGLDVLEKQRLDRLAAAVAVKHDLGVSAIADLRLCLHAFRISSGSEDVSRSEVDPFLKALEDGINKVASIFEP